MRNISKILLFLVLGSLSMNAYAEAPALLPLQGYLSDASGAAVDGTVSVKFSLYELETEGTALYSETLSVPVEDGYFNVQLGTDSALDLSLFREHSAVYLGMAVNEEAEMVPRLALGTTPYAASAAFAGLADDAAMLGGRAAADYRLASVPVPWDNISGAPMDSDTLAALGCLDGEMPVYDGSTLAWVCIPSVVDTDTDTLGALANCGEGDIPVFDGENAMWICTPQDDPVFVASPAAGITAEDITAWAAAAAWGDHAQSGYLTVETDPVFAASAAYGVTTALLDQWNAAYGWGNHADGGYLKTENDPLFAASAAYGVTTALLDQWNAAYGWGNHANAGYLKTEDDPLFAASAAYGVTTALLDQWNAAYGWGNHADGGYLKTENDPLFAASAAYGVTTALLDQWNAAYGWGNHASAGYLKTETDPVFGASVAKGITSTNVSNWDASYGWGNHASAGYLKTEADPIFGASAAKGITSTNVTNWTTAFGWGNHASAGYLKTETDPIFGASAAKNITSTNVTNWTTAYGWGNHASAGYLKTELDPVYLLSVAAGITSTNVTNWTTAYGWGNHASAGYLKTETDPIFGASAAKTITSTNVTNWNTAFGWGNHASAGYALSSSLATVATSGSYDDLIDEPWITDAFGVTLTDGRVLVSNNVKMAEAVDVSQTTGINNPWSTNGSYVAQAITAVNSGLLTKVRLKFLATAAGTYTVVIRAGAGNNTGTQLASQVFTPAGAGWADVVFTAPATVTAGSAYSIVIHSPNGTRLDTCSGCYAGGNIYWTTTGSTNAVDLVFETFVTPVVQVDVVVSEKSYLGIGTSTPTAPLHVANGDVYVAKAGAGIILTAPNGTCWKTTVSNTGVLSTVSVTCP